LVFVIGFVIGFFIGHGGAKAARNNYKHDRFAP
ncbi:MAG: hypothetical protein ACI8Z1_002194, partial [Candidatus Azotimanducaceae bacterium]